jgi:hypothetical protein
LEDLSCCNGRRRRARMEAATVDVPSASASTRALAKRLLPPNTVPVRFATVNPERIEPGAPGSLPRFPYPADSRTLSTKTVETTRAVALCRTPPTDRDMALLLTLPASPLVCETVASTPSIAQVSTREAPDIDKMVSQHRHPMIARHHLLIRKRTPDLRRVRVSADPGTRALRTRRDNRPPNHFS